MGRRRATRVAARRPPAPKRVVKRYGWVPDLPDYRDLIYRAPVRRLRALPPKVDLRRVCPPVYDQGDLGSCTANAIGAALEFDQMKQRIAEVFPPSRLFVYYNERAIEGTIDDDSGAMIRDGIKSVAKQGAPHETLWPYVIPKFRQKPPTKAYRDAAKHPAVLYQRVVPVLPQLKGCLAAGFPFVFGFSVYESFESDVVARTGRAPLPKRGEKQLGGHAVLAVGYDGPKRRFLVRNSWGTEWGMRGYFTMPFEYLLDSNLSDDFWMITLVR